jgi:TrfA protein
MKTPVPYELVPYELVPYPGEFPAFVQLPLWPETKRGAPNSLLRSALFAATQGKERRWMKEELVATFKDTTIYFTGQQLTQSDLNVWETVVHLARAHPLGTECTFTAHALLKALGRDYGKSQRDWLFATIIRLTTCTISIKRQGVGRYFGHLIDSGATQDDDRRYQLQLNKKMIALYGFSEWTQLDWIERTRLLKQPLAQWLHGFWSTHATPHPIGLETLHGLCGSNIKEVRFFKRHLKAALETLIEIAFLDSYTFEQAKDGGDLVCVSRHARPSLPPPSTPTPERIRALGTKPE